MHAHTQIRTRTHTHTHTLTNTHTPVTYQGNETEENGFQQRFKGAERGRMVDRNRELVPDNWSLVRKRAPFSDEFLH